MTKFEEKIFKNYRILAIAPHSHETYASIIYTEKEKFYSNQTVQKNIEQYCLLNGSDLAGRKKYSRVSHKDVKNPSIIVSELKGIAAYQVPGANHLDVIWITDENSMLSHHTNNGTEIILSNQEKLYTPLATNLSEKRKQKAIRLLQEAAYNLVNSHNSKNILT